MKRTWIIAAGVVAALAFGIFIAPSVWAYVPTALRTAPTAYGQGMGQGRGQNQGNQQGMMMHNGTMVQGQGQGQGRGQGQMMGQGQGQMMGQGQGQMMGQGQGQGRGQGQMMGQGQGQSRGQGQMMGQGQGQGRGQGRGQMGAVDQQSLLEVAAKTLGIDQATLQNELNSGKSIAQVAEARQVEPQTIVDAFVAAKKAQFEAMVAAGKLTQQQADAQLSTLPIHVLSMVTQGHNSYGPQNSPNR